MAGFQPLRTIQLISALTFTAALTACDGAGYTVTIEPTNSSEGIASSSPTSQAIFRSSTASTEGVKSSDSSQIIESSTSTSAPLFISSSSTYDIGSDSSEGYTRSSSSIGDIVYDDCELANSVAAPSCWRITEQPCSEEGCKITYETADFCEVKHKDIEHIFDGYDPERCNAFNQNNSEGLCERLEGRSYRSDRLLSNGSTPTGGYHWGISFSKGTMTLTQSDFSLDASYICRDEQVIVTRDKEVVLDIDADLHKLRFDPAFKDNPISYSYNNSARAPEICDAVKGNRYTTSATEDAPSGGPTQLEQGTIFFEFDKKINTLTYSYGDIIEEGEYDCDLGQLHIHFNHEAGTLTPPTQVEVHNEGESITLLGDPELTLTKEIQPPICTLEFEPVCIAQPVQCLVEPCLPIHATRGNQCQAGDLPIVFKGECGDLEGQPIMEKEDQAEDCENETTPFCVKGLHPLKNVACVTEPCAVSEYFTVVGKCEVEMARLPVSFEGRCESLKGLVDTLTFDDAPVRLFNHIDSLNFVGGTPLPTSEGIEVIESSIGEDILTVKLGYSGCNEQIIHYNIDGAGYQGRPEQAQVRGSFSKTVEDSCETYFISTYTYDLLPLRVLAKEFVESESGLGLMGLSVTYKRY